MSRLIILSGPSCIGKGPLVAALRKFYPALAEPLRPVILFNDRAARPGEIDGIDYHFRRREEIESFRGRPGYVVTEVRADLHALEIASLERIVAAGNDAFFEGNPFIPAKLREAGVLDRFDTLSVFLSPLSRAEIEYLRVPERGVDLGRFVTDVQRRKLLHRTTRQKTNLSLNDLEDIETRAGSAILEMREACIYDHVIPLHDGEGNDNWEAFYYPIGGARVALDSFAALLRGDVPDGVENWGADLIP